MTSQKPDRLVVGEIPGACSSVSSPHRDVQIAAAREPPTVRAPRLPHSLSPGYTCGLMNAPRSSPRRKIGLPLLVAAMFGTTAGVGGLAFYFVEKRIHIADGESAALIFADLAGMGAALALVGLVVWTARRLHREWNTVRDRERWLATTLRSIGDGMIATDAAGRVTLLNETARMITGWREDEARGRLHGEVFAPLRPKGREPVESPIDRALREGKNVAAPDPRLIVAKNGLEHLVIGSAAPIRDAEGGLVGAALVFHDVTQRELGEAALQASQEMFRLISDHVSDFIAVLDLQARRLYTSRSYSRHFPEKNFYLSSVYDDMHPEDIPRSRADFDEMLRTRRPQRSEFRLVRPDGSILYLESEGSVIGNASGQPDKILVVARDITERRAALEREREEREFSDTLINSLPGAFYLRDERGQLLRWNRNLEIVTGYSAEELVHVPPLDFFIPEDRPLMEDRMRICFAEGDAAAEARLLRKDGTEAAYSFTGRRIERAGRVCLLGMGLDISARISAEEALRASMRRLERQNTALSEHACSPALRDGNLEDSLRAITRFASETLGIARTSIWFYNETRTELSCPHLYEHAEDRHSTGIKLTARDYPAYFKALDEERVIAANDAATDPRTREFTPAYLLPLGITSLLDAPIRVGGRMIGVVCHEHIGPTRRWEPDEENFAGSVADLVALSTEVAQRRQAEDALRDAHASLEIKVADRTRALAAANEELKELDRLKSEFLATMSHELRTPLNSIIGFTGILRQGLAGPVNSEQAKQLGMVHFSARHLLGLINDLLDLSRIESGKMELIRGDFKIAEVVAEVAQSLQPMVLQKNLALETAIEDPALVIHSDRTKCFQILLNLANNAVKFTGTGSVRIGVRSTAGGVEVSVTDTGIGIEPTSMAHLFEAFRQVDGSARRVYEGTGLGLYLCKQLTTMLGGSIVAESEFGKGSRFAITLPANPRHTNERQDSSGRR